MGLLVWERRVRLPYTRNSARKKVPVRSDLPACLWTTGFAADRDVVSKEAAIASTPRDSDLVEALYRRFGFDSLNLLRGPLSWILWDPVKHCLLLVRDRLGTDGLYYAHIGHTVLVSSNLDSILGFGDRNWPVNPTSVIAQINGCAPLAGQTFYQDIHCVKPGEYIVFTERTQQTHRYWRLSPRPLLKLGSDAEYAKALRDLLFDVVGGYLPDKPVGITLSGGLDSTSVAAVATALQPAAKPTPFSWVTPELPEADETSPIESVCRCLHLDPIRIQADKWWPLCGEGINTRRATPMYNFYHELWDETFRVMQANGIETTFTGTSGDHLFGGDVFAYPDLLLTGRWPALIRQIKEHLPHSELGLAGIIRRMILGPMRQSYLSPRHGSPPVPWLTQAHHATYQRITCQQQRHSWLLPGRRQRLETLSDPLLSPIIEEANIHAAKFGIVLRHPLLDHRLFEFAARLPAAQTFNAAVRKIILSNSMRDLLPADVLDRRDKIYPTAILNRGLRERETEKAKVLMHNMRAAELGFVDEHRLQTEYASYLSGTRQSTLFWHTLTLEDWLRRHFNEIRI